MPSLRTATAAPFRKPRLLTALLLSLASASCEALYGGFSVDNQDNCVLNPALCSAPDQACNPTTKLCDLAMTLTAVDPPGATNTGGTLLTLSGDHFVAGMTVSIDGVPATAVTVNSAQQLTAITPPRPGRQGLVAIELTNPSGEHIQQAKLFRYYGDVVFQKLCFSGVASSTAITAVDLNGDGKTDLLVSGNNYIHSYLSTGDGQTFQSGSELALIQAPYSVATADINGDKQIDLALTVMFPGNQILTAFGNGDGSFGAPIPTGTKKTAYGLVLADLDGDHTPDAVSLEDKDLAVQLGSRSGSFQNEQLTTYPNQGSIQTSSLNLVDLDGDGLLDAVPVNQLTTSISVLFGQKGGWAAPLTIDIPIPMATPAVVAIGDYNQDGVLDLAVGLKSFVAKVLLFPGLGGRRFDAPVVLTLNPNFRLYAQGDFNRDGLPDLIALTGNTVPNNLNLYLGVGGSRFVAVPSLAVDPAVLGAAVGDWDGDGYQDLVTLSQSNDRICVLRTVPPKAAP